MYSLFLYEKDSSSNPISTKQLRNHLINIQFISEESSSSAGKEFMSLINFMGCSPVLYEDAPHSISLQTFQHKSFIGGESINSIICPHCKNKLNTQKINTNTLTYTCSSCLKSTSLEFINWRRSAALSNTFIQISNIFPKEAQPNAVLLDSVSTLTHSQWNYFYSKTLSW